MPAKGQHLSKESRQKLSQSCMGRTPWNKGIPITEEARQKLSEARKKITGWHHSEETKAKLSKTMNSPEVREKIASRLRGANNPFYGRHHSKESIERGNVGRRAWLNHPENCRKTLEGSYKGFLTLTKQLQYYIREGLPNPSERLLQEIIEEACPNEYRYNDGWFILGGKLPDFPNVNGKKKLIELFGELYHQPEEVEARKSNFAKFGWDTLIIWAKELKDREAVLQRVRDFNKKEIG